MEFAFKGAFPVIIHGGIYAGRDFFNIHSAAIRSDDAVQICTEHSRHGSDRAGSGYQILKEDHAYAGNDQGAKKIRRGKTG